MPNVGAPSTLPIGPRLASLKDWARFIVASKNLSCRVKVELQLAAGIILLKNVLWGGEAPGGEQRPANDVLTRGFQMDICGAAAAPSAVARMENGWVGPDEHLLLDGSEFHHGPAIFRVAQGGEDLSADTKIGMVHMGALLCSGKA